MPNIAWRLVMPIGSDVLVEVSTVDVAAGLVAGTLLLAGCGNTGSPSEPTPPLATLPARMFSLSGAVADTAYRPIAGAKVEVVSGARTGTGATTDEAGRFWMPGAFTGTITVVASKDGYLSSTRTVPPLRPPEHLPPVTDGERWEASFNLELVGPSPNIAGVYTLTLSADRACSNVPDEARRRSYMATIAPGYPGARTSFVATMSDARFHSIHNRAWLSIAGDFVSLSVVVTEGNTYEWPGIVEQLSETTYVAFQGWGEGTLNEFGITVPFDGSVEYCPSETLMGGRYDCRAGVAVQCYSHDHQLTLVRR